MSVRVRTIGAWWPVIGDQSWISDCIGACQFARACLLRWPFQTDLPAMALALHRPVLFSSSSDLAWSWLPPFAAVLAYPHLLAAFYQRFNGSPVLAVLAMASAFAVTVLGFAFVWRLGHAPHPTARSLTARRFAYLTVAAPPLFTFMGVLLYLMKIEGADAAVWTGLWTAAAAWVAMLQLTRRSDVDAVDEAGAAAGMQATRGLAALRVTHGISAAALIVVFLAPHLFNHLVAWLGDQAHQSLMLQLRKLYRHAWVEPAMLLAMAFQLLSGLALWLPKTRRKANLFDVLQLASGIYLTFFIASHVNSVFVLARHFGVDTNWAWAVSAPAGLTGDAWSVRLIPHYAIAVFMLLGHLACGLRVVLLGHGVSDARAGRWASIALAGATIVAIAISAAMLGARL